MLKEIEIRNFKSLKHLKYTCARLNVLTGLNGSGKSSFIQALNFVKAFSSRWQGRGLVGETVDLYRDMLQIGTYRDLLYCYAGKKRAQRVAFIGATSVESEFPVSLSIQPSPGACYRTYMDETKAFVRFLEYDLAMRRRTKPSCEEASADTRLTVWSNLLTEALRRVSITNYLSADRGAPHSVHSWTSEMYMDLGADGKMAAASLSNLWGLCLEPWACRPDCKSFFLIDQIDAWLNVVSPGAHVDFKKIPELSTVSLSYSYGTGRDFVHRTLGLDCRMSCPCSSCC